MTHRTARAAASLLTGGGPGLRCLLERAAELQRLTEAVRALLPMPLDEHCRAASLHGDALVLVCDSPAWATRLRYQAPSLLDELQRRCGLRARTLRVRVSPEETPPIAPPRRRLRLSAASAELLEQTAQATEDTALRAALLRLARRGEESERG
jgi:hypothetical protein